METNKTLSYTKLVQFHVEQVDCDTTGRRTFSVVGYDGHVWATGYSNPDHAQAKADAMNVRAGGRLF